MHLVTDPARAPRRIFARAGRTQDAYADRLARLRIEILDAFERSRSQVEAQLADLIENVQQRLLQEDEHARLAALSAESLHVIEQARVERIRRGAKGLVHLEQLVSDLVDVSLVHSD